ncbi:hypothetical protein GLOIN_2v1626898 [Rhizophagus irregularis DAOM 181602=DAOM 197198]|uniref:Uncharacterized protein n=1 Tax=Rhizophagus irregularis (strain DAOM 181602 / DAOM 197198 / MUCL 43194) TaxID=747089 RepID=A0A2P4PVQ0_RHIID|nr:hypothetical protein GLOIN_2v1626898 [Rhizophagus irregularis DAOM 181602=DAOM 197198]POG69465.1 hypothetical protein GLOIN_2v1626898 [Rhizophagus irregularis DAOM 181602=DAOM 197198]|eukprot:XP_025176331.1 hypothetical protein GLOIN_2v1626898 [Rhizophagus irregularis DAOM 181602=DAOM 197198]
MWQPCSLSFTSFLRLILLHHFPKILFILFLSLNHFPEFLFVLQLSFLILCIPLIYLHFLVLSHFFP